MDLYKKMNKELEVLFNDLFDPKKARESLERIESILKAAVVVGGPIQEQAEALFHDTIKFLNDPKSREQIELMKTHALRLKREVREL